MAPRKLARPRGSGRPLARVNLRGVAQRADVPVDHGSGRRPAHVSRNVPEEVKPLFLINLLEQLLARVESEERGQTMAEYAVVLAVITAAVIGAIAALAGGSAPITW